MKKQVYLFDESSRASTYGIGTYVQQMIVCLSKVPELLLSVVHVSADVEYFEIKEIQGHIEYYIPEPYFSTENKSHIHKRNICYLMRLNCNCAKDDKYIFLFSHMTHLDLIPYIKQRLPYSRFYLTVHFQRWCYSLNGNLSCFKRIIHANDFKELSLAEHGIYDSYVREKKYYQMADKVVCLSKFTYTLLNEEYGLSQEKLILIYNGLKDERQMLTVQKRNGLKKHLRFSTKEKIILFVGRLDAIKGADMLVQVFHDLLQIHDNYRLVIIGDGDFLPCLEKCGTDWSKVTFTGRLNKEQVYDFYQIADIGVMPSMHEQCSYVAIEMMMFGLPMVISTTTGLKEMMRNGDFGYTFDMESDSDEARRDLAFLIEKVLESPLQKLKQMRSSSRRSYEENYSIRDMQIKYLNLILSD